MRRRPITGKAGMLEGAQPDAAKVVGCQQHARPRGSTRGREYEPAVPVGEVLLVLAEGAAGLVSAMIR